MPRKTKKQVAREVVAELRRRKNVTPSQVANDASLRWVPHYRYGEAVWSDVHGAWMRFSRYEGDRIVLATLNGIADVPETSTWEQVRRTGAKV